MMGVRSSDRILGGYDLIFSSSRQRRYCSARFDGESFLGLIRRRETIDYLNEDGEEQETRMKNRVRELWRN